MRFEQVLLPFKRNLQYRHEIKGEGRFARIPLLAPSGRDGEFMQPSLLLLSHVCTVAFRIFGNVLFYLMYIQTSKKLHGPRFERLMPHADATIFRMSRRVRPRWQPIKTVHKLSSTSVHSLIYFPTGSRVSSSTIRRSSLSSRRRGSLRTTTSGGTFTTSLRSPASATGLSWGRCIR